MKMGIRAGACEGCSTRFDEARNVQRVGVFWKARCARCFLREWRVENGRPPPWCLLLMPFFLSSFFFFSTQSAPWSAMSNMHGGPAPWTQTPWSFSPKLDEGLSNHTAWRDATRTRVPVPFSLTMSGGVERVEIIQDSGPGMAELTSWVSTRMPTYFPFPRGNPPPPCSAKSFKTTVLPQTHHHTLDFQEPVAK